MSKLTKLIYHPVAFWRDAIRRRSSMQVGSDVPLAIARDHFLAGRVDDARSLLATLPGPDGAALALEATLDLYASRFEEAEWKASRSLLMLPSESGVYRNTFYLRLDTLRALGRHEQSRQMLDSMPFVDRSNRYFRALRLSVRSLGELGYFQAKAAAFGRGQPGNDRARYNYSLLLRDLGLHDEAIEIARDRVIELFSTRKFGSQPPAKKKAWVVDAQVALSDLRHDMEVAGIPFFLISGTVLGCIREGRLLGHDKDIDVGVDERFSITQIRAAIHSSQRFRIREIPSARSVYIEHANGVQVDIFQHYMQDGYYYHEGPKVRWWNSPFELKKVKFLDGDYLVPDDHNRYLTENYGNWYVPTLEFETFVDTPNMQVTVEGNLLWYYVSRLGDYHLAGKLPQLRRVWAAYQKYRKDHYIESRYLAPLLSEI